MLRFTKQTDYGLMAMQYVAEHQSGGAVGVKRIADEFGIPAELLAKVLQRLVKRGLMASQSGPRGGYRLTMPPSRVTVGQVVDALEGPVAIVSCMTDQAACAHTARCTVRRPAGRIQAAIARMLETMTLADLASDDVQTARAGDGLVAGADVNEALSVAAGVNGAVVVDREVDDRRPEGRAAGNEVNQEVESAWH